MQRPGKRQPEQTNVLLMDDNGFRTRQHRDRLQGQGYHVLSAVDASAALSIARHAVPRLIFLRSDSSGSGLTGLLQALRSDDHTRHIPVAMLPKSFDQAFERLGLRLVGRELW
jgi:twitching motility two-component system response regulator PilH